MPTSGLLKKSLLAAAAVLSLGFATVLTASAGDFSKACEENSALETGKLSDADKKSCDCIKAKLDAKTQSDTGAVLEKVLANRKAGKANDKPEMTPDEEKAMGAFVQGMQGCVTEKQ